MRVDKGNVPIEIENFIKNPNTQNIIITEIKASKHLVSRSLKKGYDIKNTSIKIKLIRYKIEDKEYYLATSILDNEISQSNFAEIYHKRWEIEEHYKLKKSILDIQHFHSKSEKGILQEIYCSALIINISRMLAAEANDLLNCEKKTHLSNYTKKVMIYLSKNIKPNLARKRQLQK